MPMPRKPRTPCPACGKDAARPGRTYCSVACKNKLHPQAHYAAMFEDCTCRTCGKDYRRNKLSLRKSDYCSKECTPRQPCPFCGKMIFGRRINKSTNARRFCSRQCSIAFYMVVQGKTNYRVHGFVATLTRRGKLVCERCGEERLHALCVHHRDRNHENLAPENLETLCGSCHLIEHNEGSAKRAQDVRASHLVYNQARRLAAEASTHSLR